MNNTCIKILNYIYLYRDGELRQSERDEMFKHISVCSECKKEYAEAALFGKAVQSSAENIPEHLFTESQMERILEGIERFEPAERVPFSEMFFQFFCKRSVRFSMAFGILFIVCSFLVQSSFTLNDVNTLEETMSSASAQKSNASVINGEELIKSLKQVYLLFKGEESYFNVNSNLILIDRDLIKNYLRTYNELTKIYNADPAGFEKKYPELSHFFSEQPDNTKLDSLLSDENLLNDLNNILKGGK